MNLLNLIDGPSALIVLGGTFVATVLRAGRSDCAAVLTKLAQLGGDRFDAKGARAELGRQIQEIHKDGLYRAHPHQFGDREFDEAAEALIQQRSIPALLAAHEAHKTRRLGEAERAVRTLAQAAELAPVFGLAGTLISLSQLPSDGIARGAFAGAISMAVITTLYGLLAANLLLAPLARVVERKALAEEAERQEMIDWLAQQIAKDMPPDRRTGLAAVSAEAV
ncbi:MAG: MotA/TolQ/ExbB proton channel family protein [Novosphingobium sp.]|uniref:MotA/TolQ/ExbB proton channel family protein n=1 Tax=Novosphingobium sp. TaxID=1874826 RepID=UPI0032BCFADD